MVGMTGLMKKDSKDRISMRILLKITLLGWKIDYGHGTPLPGHGSPCTGSHDHFALVFPSTNYRLCLSGKTVWVAFMGT